MQQKRILNICMYSFVPHSRYRYSFAIILHSFSQSIHVIEQFLQIILNIASLPFKSTHLNVAYPLFSYLEKNIYYFTHLLASRMSFLSYLAGRPYMYCAILNWNIEYKPRDLLIISILLRIKYLRAATCKIYDYSI